MLSKAELGLRYAWNLFEMVRRQRGLADAARIESQFVLGELTKTPRALRWYAGARNGSSTTDGKIPVMHSERLVQELRAVLPLQDYQIDVPAYRKHLATAGYPLSYAAGPAARHGGREQKVSEYFVTFDILDFRFGDIVLDVASEWSIFPLVAERLTGAAVYRLDLIYPAGHHGRWIGASAAEMPLQAGSVDKIVLHNAFEHFEGDADARFLREAHRVLKPGGQLLIVPLFMSEKHAIVTDPFVRTGAIAWDRGANVVRLPWWHNRFGRFYSPRALQERVLKHAEGFSVQGYHFVNPKEIDEEVILHFGVLFTKQGG